MSVYFGNLWLNDETLTIWKRLCWIFLHMDELIEGWFWQLSGRKKEDWAHPPVPTELITVGKARTGSVQQEPEFGPLLHQADARPRHPLLHTSVSYPGHKSNRGRAAVWALSRFQKQSFSRPSHFQTYVFIKQINCQICSSQTCCHCLYLQFMKERCFSYCVY